MHFTKFIPILALGMTVAAAPTAEPKSILSGVTGNLIPKLPSGGDFNSALVTDFTTIINGADKLGNTASAAVNNLISTFLINFGNAQQTANAIATVLNESQTFANSLATVLTALKATPK